MAKLDPKLGYLMPAHFGPRYFGEKTSGWYRDVTSLVVSYVTDRDALQALLPDCFEVAEEALITVAYACNKNIDWLAGHGYNLIGVHAAVIYKGRRERIEGSYTMVMWENLTDPIITGRELQGIPKIFASIPEHTDNNGTFSTRAHHFGHDIMNMSVSGLVPVPLEDVLANQAANKEKDNPMGYRFIPPVGGWGEGSGQATLFPSENKLEEVMIGEGSLDWNTLTWEQNPTQFHIVNALSKLPILEYRPAIMTRGSVNLAVADRLPRPLD